MGADGDQTGDGITNTATRFALDKVNDWDVDPDAEGVQGEQLDGIELAVTSRDGQTTYAAVSYTHLDVYKRQDQLQEVQCTFTLQRYNQGAGTWTAVLDAEGAPITQTIEGFNAETLTQEIAGAYPKYDDSGYEITYRLSLIHI